MISLDAAFVSGSQSWLPVLWSDAFLATVSVAVLGMGLADITSGFTERLSGTDEAEESEEEDGLVGDDLGDDEFGDLEGWEDQGQEFDELGDGDSRIAEVEPRIDELENEVSSISSTMGTVRSENEAINETVQEVEDNVRKLLEIYEMVTRGVNPFVDDVQGSAGGGGSFGLFEGEDTDDDEGDDVDPEVVEADADSFFDDDWEDEDAEGSDGLDDGFDEDASDSTTGNGEEAFDVEGEQGGKTFEQLKSEYEDGDADWTVSREISTEPTDGKETVADLSTEKVDEGVDEVSPTATPPNDPEAPKPVTDEPETVSEDESDRGAEKDESPREVASNPRAGSSSQTEEKPYLDSLPSGYGSELLVIEWLSYLRGCSSTPEALRAIRYYETIGWVGDTAAEELARYLTGFTDGTPDAAQKRGTQLTVDHHTRSLHYVGRLGGKEVQIERLDWSGSPRSGARREEGPHRGIQR